MPALAGAFQDRTERARLRAAVDGGCTAVLCQVLSGLGGVGKTQLAAEYAHEVWAAGEVDLLVWVSAGSRSAVVATFAEAAAEVCGADPGQPDRAAGRFLTWLQSEGRRWLVVLDDVTDPADLTGLWPPTTPFGRTVVTTRRQDAALTGAGRRRIDVDVFTPEEATAYLTAALAAYGRTEPGSELEALAAGLGHLPLALSQATAYIVDAGIPVAAYRTLLAERSARLDELSPDVLPDGQTRTTAAAWELSVEYADRLRPAGLARPMLELAAFLDANGIPVDVLTSGPARTYLAAHVDRPEVTPPEASGALRALHRLSLVQVPEPGDAAERPAVRMHQLVQRATRDALPVGRFDAAAHAAADALIDVWPEIERDTAFARTLRACAAALESYARHARCLYRPEAHPMLYQAGSSLGESGQVAAAAAYYRWLIPLITEHLGPEHPDTLVARNNGTRWQGEAGDASGAVAAFAELVEDVGRILGADHEESLVTRANLAHWQGEAGDADAAATALRKLLEDTQQILAPDAPVALAIRANLALWQGEAGDAQGAAKAYKALLKARLSLGRRPDSPEVLVTRGNLARWQGEAGDAAAAVASYESLIPDMTRVLGPDHPHTLACRGNHAKWKGLTGNASAATTGYEDLLKDMTRILSVDHPDILVVRAHLGFWRGLSEGAEAAVTVYADVVDDMMRVLGPDHRRTLVASAALRLWRELTAEAHDPPA